MRAIITTLLAIASSSLFIKNVHCTDYTPIVLWHGMGDSCCYPFSLGAIMNYLNDSMPGVHMVSLKIGSSIINDVENGYFMHPNKQVELACSILADDKKLTKGYNAIGFSQGGQFLRAVAQRCPNPSMKNLITLGGQHQGVYGLPYCGTLSQTLCDYVKQILNHAAYLSWVQDYLAQATYWHDPLQEDLYKEKSTFLAELNNENVVNKTYIKNLQNLKNFIMIRFDNDTIVDPVETEWFGFYKPGQETERQSLQESQLYAQDRLGLKKMDKDKKLHFLSTPGNHLRFEWEWFVQNVIDPFLKK